MMVEITVKFTAEVADDVDVESLSVRTRGTAQIIMDGEQELIVATSGEYETVSVEKLDD